MRETRAATIWHHVDQYLRHTRASQDDFAPEVAALYEQRTPLHARAIKFHAYAAGDNPYDVNRANAQLLFRMLKPDGPSRLPVELEEAVVLALPQPFRDECLRELAARLGLLAAPIPVGTDTTLLQQLKSPCELLRRAMAAVEPITQMLENGSICADDAEHFGVALQRLADLQSACVTVTAQIGMAMQSTNTVVPLRAGSVAR